MYSQENPQEVIIFFPNNRGGVAEVCGSLKTAFEAISFKVIEVSSIKEAILISIKRKIRFSSNKCIAITNLHYGVFGIFFKHSIFIVHGFPQREHTGYIRYKIVSWFHKVFSLVNKHTVAVSYLTKFVCQNFYGINITSVIHNILPHSFFNTFKNRQLPTKEPFSIAFVGRVLKEKGVERILQSVEMVREKLKQQVSLHIIGDGIELNYLRKKYNNPLNFFHGYVSSEIKYKLLTQCNSFISLHPAEPFGITALEASVLNVKCCLSAVGGHTEFVPHHLFFPINDVRSIEEIAISIMSSFQDNYPTDQYISLKDENKYLKDYAMKYIQILENKSSLFI